MIYGKKIKLCCSIALITALTSLPVHAGLVMFGKQDNLHEIQSVPIKGKNGEDLYLGYRTTTIYFVAPLYLQDHKYILLARGSSSYYDLNVILIEQYQASGQLPKPLPKYKISLADYLSAYGLWLFLAIILVDMLLTSMVEKIRDKRIAAMRESK